MGAIESEDLAIEYIKLLASTRSSEATDSDSFVWAHGKGGKFTVKAVYCLSRGWTEEVGWEGWRLLWRVKVHEKIKVFLWLMLHGRLLTNLGIWRRMAASAACGRCHKEDEGVPHAIKDCVVAKEVWRCLIEPELRSEFFSLGLKEWVLWIMRRGSHTRTQPRWTEKVATVCWKQWGWRNGELFNDVRLDKLQRMKHMFDRFEEDEVFYQAEDLGGLDLRRNAYYGLD